MPVYNDYFDLLYEVVLKTDESITDSLDEITLKFEDWANENIRNSQMITGDTITMTAGTGALPTDVIEFLDVKRSINQSIYAMSINRVKRGTQNGYYVKGNNLEMFNFEGDLGVEYYGEIPTLTATITTTNWLLQAGPRVYFWGVCWQAAIELKNSDLAQVAFSQLADAAQTLEVRDERLRFNNQKFAIGGDVA